MVLLRRLMSQPGRAAGLPGVVWALLAGLCGIAVVMALVGAVVVVAARPGDVAAPAPVRRGAEVALPDGRLFASSAALFADVAAGEGPGAEALDCSFRGPGGARVTPFVTDLTIGDDPVVVEGRTLQPVLVVRRVGRGWTMVCDGPGVDAAAPVYVAPQAVPAGLVWLLLPLLAVVVVLAGGFGALALRLARRAR